MAAALSDEILKGLELTAATASIPDLKYAESPYIFNFVAGHDIDAAFGTRRRYRVGLDCNRAVTENRRN